MIEELKQKAKEYNRKNVRKIIADRNVFVSTEQAYIAGAIEATKELQEEIAELKVRVSEQSGRITELTQELDDKINRFG